MMWKQSVLIIPGFLLIHNCTCNVVGMRHSGTELLQCNFTVITCDVISPGAVLQWWCSSTVIRYDTCDNVQYSIILVVLNLKFHFIKKSSPIFVSLPKMMQWHQCPDSHFFPAIALHHMTSSESPRPIFHPLPSVTSVARAASTDQYFWWKAIIGPIKWQRFTL